jgi:hypothetical protein
MDDYCWPLDESCCAEFATYPQDVQDRAAALAGMTLRMLTAYRVGGCPVTVRPCRQVCAGYSPFFGGSAFSPVNWSGTWFNCVCGGDTCGCGALCQLELPRPIGAVQEVKIDGEVLNPWSYRVDDGRWLIRLDGQCWPDCQDLGKPDTEVGTFSVTYLNAIPVDSLGQYAGGVLACEFAKACAGAKCRLPSGVTSIARQGVSYEIAAGSFPGGATGIREVDAWIARYNPYHLKTQPAVWTPDEPVLVRTVTIAPGSGGEGAAQYSVTPLREAVSVGGYAALLVTHIGVGTALDTDLTSIDWGDGTVDTAPYSRPGPMAQLISHTYRSPGVMTYVVTPTAGPPVTGTFTVTYAYALDIQPDDYEVTVNVEPFRLRPWDSYAAAPLPTNEHFASIDWADGTVDANPFTLDAEGFATHIYSEAGEHTAQVAFLTIDKTIGAWSKTVAPPPTFRVIPRPGPIYPYSYAGLQIERFDDALGAWLLANDDEIASVDWGDGTVQTAPYPTRVQRYLTHTYTTRGLKSWTVDFTHPEVASVSGTIDVLIDYYMEDKPADNRIQMGEAYGMRPLDGYQGPPLSPDTHFTSIDWGDGSPVQTPPFTLDSDGFAIHVYNAAGEFDTDAFFIDGKETGALVVVSDVPPIYSATEMNQHPVVDFADSAGLSIRQIAPTPGQATDAEIVSILWEPGVVQNPPFVRDVLGRITHTYTSFGPKNWRVDFTDPDSPPVSGTVHATYYYYIDWLPANAIIVVGGTMAMRPLDNWQGNPLPPDEHFAAIDWADGSPIEHSPFTVDASGYATHVYNTAGVYNIQIGFIDASITSLGITVTATQEEADALKDQPPPVEGKPPPDVP